MVLARRGDRTRTGRRPGHLILLTGVLLLVDAGLTLVWQEPLSALYTSIRQSELSGRSSPRSSARRPRSWS